MNRSEGVIHWAVFEKMAAPLPPSLQKVESSSMTLSNGCGNEKSARNVCREVCYTGQLLVQLVSQLDRERSSSFPQSQTRRAKFI